MAETTTKITDTQHKTWAAEGGNWNRYLKAYKGGQDYSMNVLKRHVREDEVDFQRRKEESYFLNYCQQVVDTRTAFLLKTPPVVTAPASVDSLFSNIDRQGHGINWLIQRSATLSMVTGTAVLVIDKPALDTQPISVADQAREGDRPYILALPPGNLRNFGQDDTGEMTWALIEQPAETDVLEIGASGPKITASSAPAFILWTREQIWKYDAEGNPIGVPLENRLGAVPVVLVRFREDEVNPNGYGVSLFQDIEPINRRIVAISSLLDEILSNQTFSQLTIQGEILAEKEIVNGIPRARKVDLGTQQVLQYDGSVPPEYIAPDASQAGTLLESRSKLIDEVYRLAELKRGVVREGGTESSGVSKAFDFLDTNQALARQADGLSEGIKRALSFVGRWLGLKDSIDAYSVQFPADFGVETAGDLVTEFRELASILSVTLPPALVKAYLVQIAKTRFAELSDDDLKRLVGMIESQVMGDFMQVLPAPESEREEMPEARPEMDQAVGE